MDAGARRRRRRWPFRRLGAEAIALTDADGLRIEIVERAGADAATGPEIEGLHSVRLAPADPAATARFLRDVSGRVGTGAGDGRRRFSAPRDTPGATLDLVPAHGPAEMGARVIHPFAFRTRDRTEQEASRDRLAALGLDPTPVRGPPLLPRGLVPRAGRRPLRDRHRSAGLLRGRAGGGARPDARTAALARGSPGRDRPPPAAVQDARMTADPHAGAPVLRAGPARAPLAMALLHGRGGSAGEMLRLGAPLAPAGASFFAPQAAGRSWWPTSFLAPMAALQPWLGPALVAAGRAVAAAREEGWADGRILVLGFSQGACLALEHVARSGTRLAGVCALS